MIVFEYQHSLYFSISMGIRVNITHNEYCCMLGHPANFTIRNLMGREYRNSKEKEYFKVFEYYGEKTAQNFVAGGQNIDIPFIDR